jgi:hypothetical protein
MRISVVSMVMECLIVSKRGVRGYEVNNCRVRVCEVLDCEVHGREALDSEVDGREALDSEVHGREVMVIKRLIGKCMTGILFKPCLLCVWS